jgi:hypothetical protein
MVIFGCWFCLSYLSGVIGRVFCLFFHPLFFVLCQFQFLLLRPWLLLFQLSGSLVRGVRLRSPRLRLRGFVVSWLVVLRVAFWLVVLLVLMQSCGRCFLLRPFFRFPLLRLRAWVVRPLPLVLRVWFSQLRSLAVFWWPFLVVLVPLLLRRRGLFVAVVLGPGVQ